MIRAPGGRGRLEGWPGVLRRGFVGFLVVAAIGQLFALAGGILADTGASFASTAAIGWLYVGAFHRVAITVVATSVDLPGDASGSLAVSIDVALLAVTVLAAWLLFRAGRSVADRAGGATAARIGRGAAVSLGYALPTFVLSLLVEVTTPFRLGGFAAGRLEASLSPWQALVFPLALGAVAGGAGGLRSSLGRGGPQTAFGAAIASGWWAFALATGLSIGGLFLAGVVRPDGIVALTLPTTARYVDAVFDRPALGTVVLGHHLAALPNEGLWILVPSMGACDRLRTGERVQSLCYTRFPRSVVLAIPAGADAAGESGSHVVESGRAPAWAFGFLLVPAAATILGGRRAAGSVGAVGGAGARVGMFAGVAFAALVAVGALASSITATVDATIDDVRSSSRLVAGPEPVLAALVALAWGVAGGAVGGSTAERSFRRRPSAQRPAPR